ncbi:MAG: DUF559 domain-containing protein [Phycisphaerae bacterium]|nr:DUF559 domain-containing protein [Phycisphaerae bacterium]
MIIPDPRAIARARTLRQRLTPAETKLWSRLRDRRALGVAIRRQHPIGPYVVDFACCLVLLAIELDGSSHWTRERDDPAREAFLRGEGWEVVHIAEAEVTRDVDCVAARILEAIRLRREHV